MWALKDGVTGKLYHLLTDREYTVGRKDCDIVIVNDISISRKHAIIKVIHPESNLCDPSKKSTLVIKDISKLGTRLHNERIGNGIEITLQDGDSVVFGTADTNRYAAILCPLLVTTSCLSSHQKKDVKKMILRFGGNMVNEWIAGCTHVIMSNLSVTIKVASALLSQAYVVNAAYFKDLIEVIEKGRCEKLPPVDDYLPIMTESQINPSDVSFNPIIQRSTLYVGKLFVFLMRDQFHRLSSVIKLGGGESLLVDVTVDSFQLHKKDETVILNKNNCVMLPDSNENSYQHQGHVQAISKLLSRSKLRMIPESEIGFAVLYCNTEAYCNPVSSFSNSQCKDPAKNTQQKSLKEHFDDLSVLPRNPKIMKMSESSSSTDLFAQSSLQELSKPPVKNVQSIVPSVRPQLEPENVSIKNEPSEMEFETVDRNRNEEDKDIFEESESQESVLFQKENVAFWEEKTDKTTTNNVRPALDRAKKQSRNDNTISDTSGFLRSKDMDVRLKDLEFEKETSVEGSTVVEERSLVCAARKHQNQMQSLYSVDSESVLSGYVEWNGNQVKNYKRFCKAGKGFRTRSSLVTHPRRIGGIDLVPHINADIYEAIASKAFERLEDSTPLSSMEF